jgi:hypothetical protein
LNKHPFIAKIEQEVARVIGITAEDFKTWQVGVKQDLSGPDDIHGVLLDQRCFLESFNIQSNIIAGLSTNQVRFQSSLSRVLASQARMEK